MTTTPTSPVSHQSPTLTVETPSDLLAAMPYLLGYHPDESIVLVLLDRRSVQMCARMDLRPAGGATGAAEATADRLAGVAHAHHPTGAILIAYSTDPALARTFLKAARNRLAGIDLIDVLYADGRRWWSTLDDSGCSPSDGVCYLPGSSRIAAEAVYAGMSAAASRDELAGQVAGPPPADLEALEQIAAATAAEVFDSSLQAREHMIQSVVEDFVHRRRAGESRWLTDTERLRLACLTADVAVRDRAWAMMQGSTATFHAELWQQVVQRTVPPFEAAPLCLLGMAAWISGQGTLQVCCADRVHRIDPDYSMGDLLAEINTRAMPPQFWDEMRPGIISALPEP
jgi:hypothetical protein